MTTIALSDVEDRLVKAVMEGTALDLTGGGPVTAEAMRGWAAGRTINAWVVRAIVLGRLAVGADPHGVRIRGARISGTLDLENIEASVELHLTSCYCDGGVVLRDARLERPVGFIDCLITSATANPALDGVRATVAALYLDGSQFIVAGAQPAGQSVPSVINIAGAQLGRLCLRGVQLQANGDVGYGLQGDGVVITSGLLASPQKSTLSSDNNAPFSANGAISLKGSHIGGSLDLSGAQLSGKDDSGKSVIADRASIDGNVLLSATADRRFSTAGGVSMAGAHITGMLDITGGKLGKDDRCVSFDGENIAIDANVRLAARKVTPFTGFCCNGSVRLGGAAIRGLLEIADASVGRDERGTSLIADRMTVSGSTLLRRTTQAESRFDGQVRLSGAQITGVLDMSGTQLSSGIDGISLLADRIVVGSDLDLGENRQGLFSSSGAVDLRASTIGGRLKGALVQLGVGPPQIKDDNPPGYILSLRYAKLTEVVLDPALPGRDGALVEFDGATYHGVPTADGVPTDNPLPWIHLLRHHTRAYCPHAYEQLAAANDEVGNKRDAASVRRAQQDDRRDRHLAAKANDKTPRRVRLFIRRVGLRFQGFTIGYGYRTWPAFIGVAVIALVGALLGIWAGHSSAASTGHNVAYRPATAPGGSVTNCSLVEQAAVGLHVPFLASLASGDCKLDTATGAGGGFVVGIWLLDGMGWAAATLAVAGYTGLVRQT